MIRLSVIGLFCATIASISGCGGGVHVTGTVKENGQPVKNAEVVFKFLDEEGRQFVGITNESGEIQVGTEEGLPKGKYEITIKRYVLRGGGELPSGEEGEALKESGAAELLTKTYQRDIQSSDPLEFDLSKDN